MSTKRFTVSLTVAEFSGLAYALSLMESFNEERTRPSDMDFDERQRERNAERAFAKIKAARYGEVTP